MKDFIAIDFETANPKRVSACALGYVRVSNGGIIESQSYLIKPVGGHHQFQSNIHGITEEHTSDKPSFKELFPEIKSIFDSKLVAHSCFDQQVLKALSEYFRLNIEFRSNYTDSCKVAREKLPGLKNHKLRTLAKHLGIPDFKHHDSEEDALACARIFLKLLNLSDENAQESPGDEFSEFDKIVRSVLEDDKVDYKEAYGLLDWLEDHPVVCNENKQIYTKLKEVLEDNILDSTEATEVKDALNKLLRKP